MNISSVRSTQFEKIASLKLLISELKITLLHPALLVVAIDIVIIIISM